MSRWLPWLLGMWLTWTAAAAPEKTRFLLLPLDNRPCNVLFVRQLARIAGADVVVPPNHWLGSWLNPGNCLRLGEWLLANCRPGDTVIVSSDMLCYGGLVASRNASTSETEALQRLEVLDRLRQKRPDIHLEVLATVPRLYLRTSDPQAPYEAALAGWAAQVDQEPTAADFPTDVPRNFVEEYLGVRHRNRAVLLSLVQRLRAGRLDRLVIGQDDSSAHGLHHLDQQALRAQIGADSRAMLLSGADELSMDMVAGRLAELYQVHPRLGLEFSEAGSERRIPPLESHPLITMLEQHLQLVGAYPAAPEDKEDVHVFVQVPAERPFAMPPPEQRPQSSAFAERVRESIVRGRATAVADLALINRMDPYLAQALLDRVPLTRLESLAAWNTPANAFGTVAAHLVVRQIAEREARHWKIAPVRESARTHYAFLLARIIDDYGYQTLLRSELYPRAKGLPARPDPLLSPYVPLGREVRQRLIEWSRDLYARRFEHLPIELPAGRGPARLGAMALEVVLPWPRLFEVQVRLDVTLLPLLPAPTVNLPANGPDATVDVF